MMKKNNIKRKHRILLIVAKQLCICIPLHFWSAWVVEQPKKKKSSHLFNFTAYQLVQRS